MTALPTRPRWTLGFVGRRAAVGLGVGVVIPLTAAALLWATGAYHLDGWAGHRPTMLALGLPLFAWVEELIFRRLLLERLVRWWGRAAGLLLSAAAFAGLHAMNPGGGSPASVFGVFLAGLWLGQLYLQRRRLVASTVAHLTWNVMLGPVIGFPVSGLWLGGLLSWTARGGALTTGGEFGPEASLWTWLVFATAIVALELIHRYWLRSERTEAQREDPILRDGA